MNSLWSEFKKGIIAENPIFVLALSLCPALAVTSSATTSLTMGLSVMFVITMNNCVVSLIRNVVNPKVRVPVYITSIATIVTVVQLALQAYAPALYDALGIYLALIVVFAIILARAESFASKHTLIPSFFDGLGMGVGFCVALVIIGVLRELFGAGSIFGVKLLGDWYNAPLIMILPAGGFMLIGYLIGGWKMLVQHMEKKEAERSEA
ncbi:electron transport complex subunit RsxE [Acetobacterium fimetarium]|uniref:Ion-translocating oxidoreductase complex subunit E n=1 Tax=Acetobacterium fimetarium TaxID=52691 RepID=A0ABR6WVN6_9FIRM|nr:electron transport complex subunit E [Acetobacterium fimetarium]MBC3804493.1 electron transport complex subunit RsxE [Acetobacterium fimetarium]